MFYCFVFVFFFSGLRGIEAHVLFRSIKGLSKYNQEPRSTEDSVRYVLRELKQRRQPRQRERDQSNRLRVRSIGKSGFRF